ncbi:hypothetical protein [Qaidamihabitans albus]|uniref:hypothetical protein n=1 Tax=Qaidamihabitans albus TaxID=2795733 RepID=UPI0018F23B12|nr:hypothetical protein [Qaidamihabitans albus]
MVAHDPIVSPLQASVHGRLAEISRAAAEDGGAGRELALLVDALRTVLGEHRLDPRGHCTVCHGRRPRLFPRRRGGLPCRAYLAVQGALGAGAEDIPVQPAIRRHHRRRNSALHYAG